MKSQKLPSSLYLSSRWLLAVSFGMVIVLTMMFLFPGLPVGAADCNNYTISFLGSTFDGTNTAFSYEVSVCALPKIKDWILGLPDCGVTLDDIASAGPGDWEVKYEGAAELFGVKFKQDIDYPGGDCNLVTFYVTLIGNWSTGVAQAAIHPDHEDWCQKTTQGPVCPVLTMAVSPAGAGTTSPAVGTHTYGYGNAVPIEASPSTGWKFDHWEGDVTGSTNPDSVTMNGDKSVTAVFDHPVNAVDDTYSTAEDTLCSVPVPGVMANDSAPDGGESVTLVSDVSHGTLSLAPNGSFTYLPDSNFSGSDSFVYELSDGDGDSDTATVTITITAVNDPPVANDDSATVNEDSANTVIDVLSNDTDVDGDTLTVASVTQPANGSVTNNGTNVSYTPDGNYHGSDTFTYTVSDGNGGTDTATVSVTVTSVNDPPVANDDSDTTPEDTPVTTNVVANDTDVDGTVVASAVAIVSGPRNGSILNNGDGTVTYTPNANFNGSDTYTYTVQDNDGATSNVATVTINVGVVNDPPVANDDSATVNEDSANTVIDVLSNDTDVDGDTLTVASVTQPANGSVTNNGTNVSYTPDGNYHGSDTFTYTVSDGNGGTDTATATVSATVTSVNDPPVANDDMVLADEDTPLPIEVTLNDDDPDGTIDPATIMIDDAPVSGTVRVAKDGTVTYSPDPDFSGPDFFTYTVDDNEGATSNVATVVVMVGEVNDPPVAEDDLATTEAGVPVNIDVLANDSDPDGSCLIPGTVTIMSGPESGTATVNWDGTITYTLVDGFVGTDQFTYTVEDDDAIGSEATVTVEVLEVTGGGGTELADTVPGTEVLSGRVIGVKKVENDPLTFEVSFQNTGNVQLRPKGRLDIISRSGDTVRSIIIEEFPLLPRAVRYLRIVDASVEPLSPGRYLALAVLDFGNPDYLTGGQLAFDVKELYLVPIGDSASLPRDLDGDGLYEHINGDGKLTLEDPALLGFYIDSPAVQENTKAFDFNNDGIVNFNDAVVLKSMVEEQQIR